MIREFIMHSEKYSVYEVNKEEKITFDWKNQQNKMINEGNEEIRIEEIKETLQNSNE